jgi:protoheme IX farnesyltransferase
MRPESHRAGTAAPASFASRAGEYFQLTKPRVVALIVFTAIVGRFLAVPGLPPAGGLFSGARSASAPSV